MKIVHEVGLHTKNIQIHNQFVHKKRNNVPDVHQNENITGQLQHIVSYHHQFYNAFHIPNHIIINFVPPHIINSSNGEQAASSISQIRRKTLTAQLNITSPYSSNLGGLAPCKNTASKSCGYRL